MKQVKLESPHLVTSSKGNTKIVIESSQYKKEKKKKPAIQQGYKLLVSFPRKKVYEEELLKI